MSSELVTENSIVWCCSTESGFLAKTKLPADPALADFSQIEAMILPLVPLNATRLRIEFVRPDGSGRRALYLKRGTVWINAWAHNIVPRWFPWVFFALIFGAPIISIVICWWLGIK